MTTATAPATTTAIELQNVTSVYSGRPGCACGCRGKHTYASAHREWASANRGYAVTDDEIGDRTVAMMVNKINRFAAEGLEIDRGPNYVAHETETRLYIAYFRD